MIAADAEGLWQAFEHAHAAMADHGGLAMHRVIQHAELASERFHHALQAEAHTEQRHFQFGRVADQVRHSESAGAAAPRGARNRRVACRWHSASLWAGMEPWSRVVWAGSGARPPRRGGVGMVIRVVRPPARESMPGPRPYQPRASTSRFSMACA